MLASDLNNPAFVGPSNPDSMLHVEFYNHAALDSWATAQTGIKTYLKECPFVRISVPGNDKTIIERPAHNGDVERFPRQWMHFQMQTGMIANAENVPGWQIDEWDALNDEQRRNLKFLRFYTVEQIAGANDAQIQGIGMGGLGLREQARKALSERNAAMVQNAVSERDREIAELKAQMAEMMAMLKQDAPKRGRPAKDAE